MPFELCFFILFVHVTQKLAHILAQENGVVGLHESLTCQLVIKELIEPAQFVLLLLLTLGLGDHNPFGQRCHDLLESVALKLNVL